MSAAIKTPHAQNARSVVHSAFLCHVPCGAFGHAAVPHGSRPYSTLLAGGAQRTPDFYPAVPPSALYF